MILPWKREATAAAARRESGRKAEHLAAIHLVRAGLRILESNVRFRVGEIDLVAKDGPTLVLVEVRSTSSDAWGGPLATVTDRKRGRLIRAARCYLDRLADSYGEVRFDVVAVSWSAGGENRIQWIKDAFTADVPG